MEGSSTTEGSAGRQMARRALLPTRNVLEEIGDMVVLTGRTISSAVRPPYPYGEEFVAQFLFVLRLVWFPLLVTTVAINYGAPGLQAANFLRLFGAADRLGGFFVLAAIREIGPLITSIVLAGYSRDGHHRGSGGAQDPRGARRVAGAGCRPGQEPRGAAVSGADADHGLFDLYALLFGIFGGILAALVTGQPLGPFWATLFANATSTDLWGSVLKTMLFGAIIAIVCCYKGMTASGGAEGVGRAVNQAVVISFLGIGAFNYVFTQMLLATHPNILVIKRERTAGPAARMGRRDGRNRELHGRGRAQRVGVAGAAVLRRGPASGGHPDRRLDARHLGTGVHHRPRHVRHRGRLFPGVSGCACVRGRVHRIVQPARGRPVRVWVHDVREGRHGDRGGARGDADQRGDRRAGGDGV